MTYFRWLLLVRFNGTFFLPNPSLVGCRLCTFLILGRFFFYYSRARSSTAAAAATTNNRQCNVCRHFTHVRELKEHYTEVGYLAKDRTFYCDLRYGQCKIVHSTCCCCCWCWIKPGKRKKELSHILQCVRT